MMCYYWHGTECASIEMVCGCCASIGNDVLLLRWFVDSLLLLWDGMFGVLS